MNHMKPLLFAMAAVALSATFAAAPVARPALAQADATPAPSTLSYDDPAVHYTAPEGWTRIEIPEGAGEGAPTAAFTKEFSRYDTRVISLKIDRYDGSLNGLEATHESDLRSQFEDVFIDKKTQIVLSNGMPAWQLKYTAGSSSGQSVRTMEDVVYDGKRSIELSYSGRAGSYDDKDAVAALSTLTVVVYPEGRI
jgi:hypothetical protein